MVKVSPKLHEKQQTANNNTNNVQKRRKIQEQINTLLT